MAFAETFKALSDPVRREILNSAQGRTLNSRRDRRAFRYDCRYGVLSPVPTEKGGTDF